MLSLRLPDETIRRITTVSKARGLTRSEWLRRAVDHAIAAEETRPDAYALYSGLMAELDAAGARTGSGSPDLGLQHSARLKAKLRATHRR